MWRSSTDWPTRFFKGRILNYFFEDAGSRDDNREDKSPKRLLKLVFSASN